MLGKKLINSKERERALFGLNHIFDEYISQFLHLIQGQNTSNKKDKVNLCLSFKCFIFYFLLQSFVINCNTAVGFQYSASWQNVSNAVI